MVDVILLERVEKLGQMGQVVKVRPGYARNYLLPQKKALRATKENLAYFETQRAQLEAQNLTRRTEAEEVAKTLNGVSVMVIRQAGESGQLYGSVTARDVAEAVTQAGFTIGRSQVVLEKAIKTLGLYKQRVVLHPEVSVTVTVNVAQSAEEAEMQAKGVDPLRLAQEAAAREAAAAEATAPSAAPAEEQPEEAEAPQPREAAKPKEAKTKDAAKPKEAKPREAKAKGARAKEARPKKG
jgi:large subunit ribosomal protein L9